MSDETQENMTGLAVFGICFLLGMIVSILFA